MSTPIENVENWLDAPKDMDALAAARLPTDDIRAVLEHAKLSDEYIRMIYRVIGWMYKDASGIMALGLTDTYRGLSIDQVFSRVCKELDLPEPLDMAPSVDESPDSPRIQLIT